MVNTKTRLLIGKTHLKTHLQIKTSCRIVADIMPVALALGCRFFQQGFVKRGFPMSLKLSLAAIILSAASTLAFAQTVPTPTNPLRPATPTAPAAPAVPAAPAARATTPAPAATAPAKQGQLVNLNTATKGELDSLPQIGDARATAIIAKRPYKDWTDFTAKNVVPANAEAAIKDKVRFR